MECNPLIARCPLDRIADSLDRFDWGGTFATLAASFVGALVAALAAWFVYLGEKRGRYGARLVDGAEQTSLAISNFASEHRRYLAELPKFFALSDEERTEDRRPREPDRTTLDVTLDMLIAKTRQKDREIAVRVRSLAYELTFIPDASWSHGEYSSLRRVLSAWASRRKTPDETLASLRVLWRRREQKEESPNIPEVELPEPPERYERPNFNEASPRSRLAWLRRRHKATDDSGSTPTK